MVLNYIAWRIGEKRDYQLYRIGHRSKTRSPDMIDKEQYIINFIQVHLYIVYNQIQVAQL